MSEMDIGHCGIVRVGELLVGIPVAQLSEVFIATDTRPMPRSGDYIRNGIELRGHLVPLLELEAMTGQSQSASDTARFGVVVERNALRLGIKVDHIEGIVKTNEASVRALRSAADSKDGLFHAVFPHEDAFVMVLNVEKLFETPGLVAAPKAISKDKAAHGRSRQLMTFVAGGTCFAVPAIQVSAAVPKRTIQRSSIRSGPCLGEIDYHGCRVAILSTAKILGLGNWVDNPAHEVLVLRLPNNDIIGLAVDSIRDIRTFTSATKAVVPNGFSEFSAVTQAFVDPQDDTPIYLVDVEDLAEHPDLITFAKFSRETEAVQTAPDEAGETKSDADEDDGNIVHVRERYLLVDAQERLAVPLLQVNCILSAPEHVTPAASDQPGFRGYFTWLGEMVALIDLKEALGHGRTSPESAKVLLTTQDDRKVAFCVDRVISIETSGWREKKAHPVRGTRGPLVKLGSDRGKMVLPCFDLAENFKIDAALEPALPT